MKNRVERSDEQLSQMAASARFHLQELTAQCNELRKSGITVTAFFGRGDGDFTGEFRAERPIESVSL